MHGVVHCCPTCGEETGLDINYEGKYIVSKIVCENDECSEWELGEFSRDHEDDTWQEYLDSISE